ncbi:MAG: alpha/beta fold hydrolase [Candidatus Dependentiae bacterium]|nr:alpha/beta fold hydrolase [Candidatus Dependentiae bacterium]
MLVIQTNNLFASQQPTTLFLHGIIDTKKQLHRYEDFIQHPKKSFDFPDAQKPLDWDLNNLIFKVCSSFGKHVNRTKMFMGQGEDIETLKNEIKPDESYILFGFSRGGAAAINYLAQYNPKNIQALILNASPADMLETVNTMQHNFGYKFAPTRADQEYIFATMFPAYPMNSTPPVDAIAHIKNKDLPIFIVHAQTDSVVHISASWQLYKAFLQAKFTDVYLCQLKSGEHKAYPNSPDKETFLHALHSFYKKYGFDYNPKYATLSDEQLHELQPTEEEITAKLDQYARQLVAAYEKQNSLNNSIVAATAGISLAVLATAFIRSQKSIS